MTAEAAANAEPSLACERRHRAYVVIRARQLHTGGELEPAHAAVAAAQVASAFTRAAGWRRGTPAHVDGERLAARARVRFMDEVLPAGNSHVADVTRWFGGNSIVQPCAC